MTRALALLCAFFAMGCTVEVDPMREVYDKGIDFARHTYCTTCETDKVIRITPERHTLLLVVGYRTLMVCHVSEEIHKAARKGMMFDQRNCEP